MKNLFAAVILGIALAGAALAYTSTEEKSVEGTVVGRADEVKMAVVEFSPGAKVSGMTPEAKRQLQTALAAALARSRKFDVADVRWTRNESANDLAAINAGSSTAAAVKLGKKLGVKYVLTGTIVEYTLKDADDFGRVVLKTRLIEVATGKVRHADEITQRSTGAMRTSGAVEMQAKAVKPAIDKLAAALLELRL